MATKPMAPVILAKTDMMGWWRHEKPWGVEDEITPSVHAPRELYIHRDAARAWQHVRDFFNGTPGQWLEQIAIERLNRDSNHG